MFQINTDLDKLLLQSTEVLNQLHEVFVVLGCSAMFDQGSQSTV